VRRLVPALCAVLATTFSAAGFSLTRLSEHPLPVEGASGIAYAGGARFYVVRDHNARGEAELHALDLDFDLRTGALRACRTGRVVPLKGNHDSEGVAFDAARNCMWVSDEEGPSIRAFGVDGAPLGAAAPIPEIQRRFKVPNRSLEALALCGDELWTANEEALSCDGARSSPWTNTVVRLQRYVRAGAEAPWRAAESRPYACAPCAPSFGPSQNGLAGLCALEDGSLLALEREVSATTCGRCEIYRITPAARAEATDVTSVPALAGTAWRGVGKGRPVLSFLGGRAEEVIVYEGICAGPRLTDGSRIVCLVSDGGLVRAARGVMVKTAARLCVLRMELK